ncbi:unnamed protein product [Lymnaea stagnalis]|uniref:G-protein coupled receptors family 1 profile domain-containing protein n=1 Tax=Lymnaea stagnalis TaxID=6523 RepID=A0AAV2HXL7_LYMST
MESECWNISLEGSDTTVNVGSEADAFSSRDLLSDDLAHIFTLANFVVISGTVSLFGLIFNLINIAVFSKLDFSDTTNITLLSLSIADAGILLTLIWLSLCYNPLVAKSFPNLDFMAIQHVSGGWPNICFSRVSGWLTVFITFERYLCIAAPLKVKTILTPSRTVAINVIIYVIMAAAVVPVYLACRLEPSFSPSLNRSVISLVYGEYGHELESFSLSFNVFAQLTAFTLVVLCTTGLTRTFLHKVQWRNKASSSGSNAGMSTRDKKLVKMIILIAAIFIVSSLPGVVGILAMSCYEDYNITGRYKNLFVTSWAFFFTLGSINSTVNIFVYLYMSTKFRETLLSIFRLGQRLKKT